MAPTESSPNQPRTSRYPTPPITRDHSVFYVEWDDLSHRFTSFGGAKQHLLNELWWLAEDLQHEPTFAAWAEVCSWIAEAPFPRVVVAGDPPATYRIEKRPA